MGARLYLFWVALFAFLGAIASDHAATTPLPIPAFSAIRKMHERIRAAHVEKREIDSRQASQCQFPPPDYPSECNTYLTTRINISIAAINDQSLTPMQEENLNAALTQFCVPRCVDPYITYLVNCSNVPSFQEYSRQLIRQGLCGKEGNDFCDVVYLRYYSDNSLFLNRLVNVDCAPLVTTGSILTVNCSTSDVCAENVANFAANMGCCAIPYLGAVTPSCGVTPDPPCQSAVSGSGPAIYLAMLPIVLLAILSVGFLF